MTISFSVNIPALLSQLSEEDQHRFFDAAVSGEAMPQDILDKLTELSQEAQAMIG